MGEKWIADGQDGAEHGGDQDPEQDLLGGDQEVAPQQRAVVVQRLATWWGEGRIAREGRALEIDVQLPDADQREQQEHGGKGLGDAPHESTPSAVSAASRSSTTAPSVRLRGRGSVTSISATASAGPRRHHHDPVPQHHRLLDVVGDQDHRSRLGLEHVPEPALHLLAGDRVERGERLVEGQDGLAGEQRAQERHALAHAPRQLRRPGAFEAVQSEALEPGSGGLARFVTRHATRAQREARRCRSRSATAGAGRAGA